jgi:hypothetical protein
LLGISFFAGLPYDDTGMALPSAYDIQVDDLGFY